MATYYSQGSGNWSTLSNWKDTRSGGNPPASVAAMNQQTMVVQPNHAICVDQDFAASWADGIAGLTIERSDTTPGKVYAKYDADGTYSLKIATSYSIQGAGTGAQKGQLVATADGTLADTDPMPWGRNFYLYLVGTAGILYTALDVTMRCDEPATKVIRIYESKGTVTADADTDRLTWTGHSLAANDPVCFRSTGTLPGGLIEDHAYYVRAISGDTFKVSQNDTDTYIIDLTSAGSGTITCYRGYAGTTDTTFNVVEDVSADPQWSVANVPVVICNPLRPPGGTTVRTTVSALTATTITLAASLGQEIFGLGAIVLAVRNVAIRSSSTSASANVINAGSSDGTSAIILDCEVRNTAGTGTTTYSYGINYGGGSHLGGVWCGWNAPTYYCSGITFAGISVSCSSGLFRTHLINFTGMIIGSTNYAAQALLGGVFAGTAWGCSSGLSQCTNLRVTGTLIGGSPLFSDCRAVVIEGTAKCIGQSWSSFSDLEVMPDATMSWSYDSTANPLSLIGFAIQTTVSVNASRVLLHGQNPRYLTWNNRNNPNTHAYQCVLHDAYLGTFGAHRAEWNFGDCIKNDSVVRGGGAASSIEVVPLSQCGHSSDCFIPILEWMETDVPASAQTRSIYIKGSEAGDTDWSPMPTDAQLWFEAEYYDDASGLTRTVKHTYDAGVDTVLPDNDTWTAFSLTFTPGRAGHVRYRVFLATYQSGAKVYVDNMLVAA